MIEVKSMEKNICFNCKNFFEEGIEINFNRKFFNNYKLCNNCAKTLFLELSKNFIPKGIKSKSFECKILQ